MRAKLLVTNILLALALVPAATGARADSLSPGGGGGAANITIGSTPVSGTAGLLFSDGTYVQSLPGTYAAGSGYIGNIFTLSNGTYLALQSDGSKSTAPLTVSITSSAYNYNNLAEFYAVAGGINYLSTYINSAGIYTSLAVIASGHTTGGPGAGRQITLPSVYIPSMFAGWGDIIGPIYLSRDGFASPGAFAFLGLNASGVATIALDAQYSQFVLGSQTCVSSCIFAGDTFLSRAAAANWRFGGADAASPVAQTISFQNVLAGTSNTAGVNTTFQASAGTGTGVGGKFLFQTALPGSSGTTQNGFSTALTIDGASGLTIGYMGSSNVSQLFFTPNSGTGVGLGMSSGGSMLLALNSGNGQIGGVWGSGFVVPNSECYAFANSSSSVTGGGAIALCMVSSSVLNLTAGYSGSTSGSLAATSFITPPLTYSTLPSGIAGATAFITDAATSTYGATVSAGGGSNKVHVLYTGSNWVVD